MQLPKGTFILASLGTALIGFTLGITFLFRTTGEATPLLIYLPLLFVFVIGLGAILLAGYGVILSVGDWLRKRRTDRSNTM